jgi:murein L,D-transpeptidase YcbB/YkuD
MKIIDSSGRVIRPSRINWAKVDIRRIPIVQGPGPGNPLGRMKFIFPNAHDVYMHDTPDKHLFNASVRTFSHGCMRLRNPQRYAEIILAERRGFTPDDVAQQLSVKDTVKVDLLDHVPVHVTYFTVVPDGHGGLRFLDDIYDHDRRIADAFAGVPYAKIAARDPALAQLRENQELARRKGIRSSKRSREVVQAAARRTNTASVRRSTPAKPKPYSLFFN